jgi:hypothetical protein
MKTFSEEEVANLISYACNMVTCESGPQFEEGYKWLIKNKTISNNLVRHIMAVIQSCRKN